jgi:hypothetical protein
LNQVPLAIFRKRAIGRLISGKHGKRREMTVYSVLEPARAADGSPAAPERFAFVRDGFNWAAFLFGPLWMLWRGLWLVLLGYILAMVALETAYRALGASFGVRTLIGILIALLIGLEAASLRRWTLLRRGWRDRGIVVADDLESAEHRFFSDWATGIDVETRAPVAPASAGFARRISMSSPTGVVGLFPPAGGGR